MLSRNPLQRQVRPLDGVVRAVPPSPWAQDDRLSGSVLVAAPRLRSATAGLPRPLGSLVLLEAHKPSVITMR